jgi:hypothetical protein
VRGETFWMKHSMEIDVFNLSFNWLARDEMISFEATKRKIEGKNERNTREKGC